MVEQKDGWPEVELLRVTNGGVELYDDERHFDTENPTETYVPLQSVRERLLSADTKDALFQEAVKHMSFESPEHQEDYVWELVDGVAKLLADSVFGEPTQ